MAVGSDAKALVEAISGSGRFSSVVTKKARVINIDGKTAWVSVIGGAPRTPCTMGVSCKPNDYVMVTFADSRAIITSNMTSPATDDTEADAAHELADVAATEAGRAYSSAQIAENAAVHAENAAAHAEESADTARDEARRAYDYAEQAYDSLEEIRQDAEDAKTAAEAAQGSADKAANSASDAAGSANEASTQAKNAGASASAALGRLSDVENVVGTFEWIQRHGRYVSAAGTDFDQDKSYFIYDSETNRYVHVSNPVPENIDSYYLLDVSESVEQYIANHVSLNDDGLWLTGDSNRYSVLVSSGSDRYAAGMHVISDGREVAYYGETTIIGDSSKAHIEISDTNVSFKTADGSEVAYIAVDEVSGESMFYMTRAVVVKDLRFGYWKWADRSNRNMALKWMGE